MTGKFNLRRIDPETNCFTEQSVFQEQDLIELEKLLSEPAPEVGTAIEIDGETTDKIVKYYNLSIRIGAEQGELFHEYPDSKHDPNSHTGRELLLMLQGKKPFASFVEILPNDQGLELIPERFFEPHVQSGRFNKIEFLEDLSGSKTQKIRKIFYAVPGEEWRAKAHIMLFDLAKKYGWKPEFELIEGYLLGYENNPETNSLPPK